MWGGVAEMQADNVVGVAETEGSFQLNGNKSDPGRYLGLTAAVDADSPHPELELKSNLKELWGEFAVGPYLSGNDLAAALDVPGVAEAYFAARQFGGGEVVVPVEKHDAFVTHPGCL